MKRLTEAVNAYLEENPEAGEADVIEAFGTPEDCAAELLAECDPARVAAVRRRRRWLLYGTVAVLAVLVVSLVWLFVFRSPGTPEMPDGAPPAAPEEPVWVYEHGHGHGSEHH